MAARPRKISESRTATPFGELKVPTRIIFETRNNTRASITAKALILRLPAALTESQRTDKIESLLAWARKTYAKKPEVFAHFHRRSRSERYTFSIRGDDYAIVIGEKEGGSHRIRQTVPGHLEITLNTQDERAGDEHLIELLLSKYFAGRYSPLVDRRVRELNDQHFQQVVRQVRLKNTTSRWGSCSRTGNINLATRLLLAPPAVLDAVIIHELAHLIIANHSPSFYEQVARALPDYKKHDRWLREHGRSLRFQPEVAP